MCDTTITTGIAGSTKRASCPSTVRIRLSYTTFAYSNLVVTKPAIGESENLTVTVDVQNTGSVTDPRCAALRRLRQYRSQDRLGPPREGAQGLRPRSDIAPSAKQTATLTVKASDLAYWDETAKTMKVEKMAYQLT